MPSGGSIIISLIVIFALVATVLLTGVGTTEKKESKN
jgi:hypothetical protein